MGISIKLRAHPINDEFSVTGNKTITVNLIDPLEHQNAFVETYPWSVGNTKKKQLPKNQTLKCDIFMHGGTAKKTRFDDYYASL